MRLHRAFIFFLAGFLGGMIILWSLLAVIQMQRRHAISSEVHTDQNPNTFVINENSGLFVQTLSEMTYDETPDTGGLIRTSPSGRYVLFDAINPPNDNGEGFFRRLYLGDLVTGARKEIIGEPTKTWLDDDVLLTVDGTTLHLFDTVSPDSPLESYEMGEIIFDAIPSPDRTTLAINTSDGVYLADRASGTKRKIIDGGQNGAYTWFNDGNTMLGFRPINETQHELVYWNTQNGEYNFIPDLVFPTSTINYVSWLVPDTIAQVNTGWDDGSFDYVVNVTTGGVHYLGETSGEGSIHHQSALRRLGTHHLRSSNNRFRRVIENTSYFGDVSKRLIFDDRYRRYAVHLVDMDYAVYLRQDMLSSQTETEVILANLNTKKEHVLYSVNHSVSDLAITRDELTTYWIIPTEHKLLIRSLDLIDLE